MLIIETQFGNFGHPNDLLRFIEEEDIMHAKVHVKYCCEEVLERDMSLKEIREWARGFVSPIAGTLEEAIQWLKLGLKEADKDKTDSSK